MRILFSKFLEVNKGIFTNDETGYVFSSLPACGLAARSSLRRSTTRLVGKLLTARCKMIVLKMQETEMNTEYVL